MFTLSLCRKKLSIKKKISKKKEKKKKRERELAIIFNSTTFIYTNTTLIM